VTARDEAGFPFFEQTPKGVFIRVRVRPRGSRNAVEGVRDGSLMLRVTSPPIEGEANRAVIKTLSAWLGVRKSSLSIESGERAREKRVRVEGMGIAELKERVEGRLRGHATGSS